MTSGGDVGENELRFINLVAARRFAKADPAPPRALGDALAQRAGDTPFQRAASLAGALLAGGVFGVAPRPTVLLAICVQLDLDGYELLAPQGAAAGMIAALAAGRTDAHAVARWLEDRAVSLRTDA